MHILDLGIEILHLVLLERAMVVHPDYRDVKGIDEIILQNSKVKDEHLISPIFQSAKSEIGIEPGRCLHDMSLALFLVPIQQKKRAQSVLVVIKEEEGLVAFIELCAYLRVLLF